MEEIITPGFIYPAQAPVWTAGELASFIVEPGLSEEKVARRIRRMAQHGWLPVVGSRGSGVTAANLFPIYAAYMAAVLEELSTVTEDKRLLGRVSLALYAHQGRRPAKSQSAPIVAAALEAEQGKWWALDVTQFRSDQTGARDLAVRLYDTEGPHTATPEHPQPDMLPTLSLSMLLPPLLLPVHQRLRRALEAAPAY